MQPGLSKRTKTEASPRRLLVFGAAGHAKVVLDILRLIGSVIVVGLIDDYKSIGSKCLGHEVVGALRDLPAISAKLRRPEIVVGIGDNWRRAQIVTEIRAAQPDTVFARAVHPSAQVGSQVTVGEGTVIMAGAVVNAGCTIGPFCILNTKASLDHDSSMAAYSSLAPGVTTGGAVVVGAFSNVGIGATILPSVSIGQHVVIGAGAVVVKAIPDRVVAYGIPARIVRSREPGDGYLGPVAKGHSA
jgi:sugar O-acyltransferase (sialic acid O-acetyltransferase NeuD family)